MHQALVADLGLTEGQRFDEKGPFQLLEVSQVITRLVVLERMDSDKVKPDQ